MNKELIEKNFSKKAIEYDEQAIIQKEVARELLSKIPNKNYKNILDIGCGTGFLTSLVKNTFPDANVTGIDNSLGMIDIAKRMNRNIKFKCIDANRIDLMDEEYDLIVSSMALHWIENLPEWLVRVNKVMSENGSLYFVLPIKNTLYELERSFNYAYKELGLINQKHVIDFYLDEKIEKSISNYNVDFVEKNEYQKKYDDIKLMINSIKGIGGGYSFGNSLDFSMRKKMFNKAFDYYQKHYSDSNGKILQTWAFLFVGVNKVV
jgi:malonyl-CoA O-methyltransferase